MARKLLPQHVDTVIVGNGPSALILSFILHGNIPYYNPSMPHPDPILHAKLLESPCLLDIDITSLTAHFRASRLSYSTQALPVNVLLDTLLQPLADTEPGQYESCVQWHYEPTKALRHAVIGNTAQAGGQWADNPVAASWDIGTLSYAEMLSLPGYSFVDHYRSIYGAAPKEFHRPSRREVAEYLATYPGVAGINDSVWTAIEVGNISRTANGFHIASHNIDCQHLVLASGIFSHLIPPRPLLQPLVNVGDHCPNESFPLLVVGSGFTAADIIISAPSHRKIIHIFKWAPEEHPSPLRACHPQAYPEYAGVYRRMKLSAIKGLGKQSILSPMRRRKSNSFFDQRDWDGLYEGLPNTWIKAVSTHENSATVTLEGPAGQIFERDISDLKYVIGRRGSLQYLDVPLQTEVLSLESSDGNATSMSGQTLRSKVEEDLEVAPDVFVIGNLTGDSLIRFAFGGCVYAARGIMARSTGQHHQFQKPSTHYNKANDNRNNDNEYISTNGHIDLGLGRTERSKSIDIEIAKSELWRRVGWLAGGCSIS
ncbi:hypothetical protein MMC24_003770 [Lignoscripta atroalba]|nr:hypothetical protein [Lignoscripta atroalba]